MHRGSIRLVALTAACFVLAVPASSYAHAGIKSYSPKRNSTVARSLASVRITFKARISDGNLTVRSVSGKKVSRGPGRVVSNHRALRALLRSGLRAGRYTAAVKWLNTDGHVETESWSFRLR